MNRLKQKWGITSAWQFWAIMAVFSLAGLAITQVRRPLFHVFGLDTPETPFLVKVLVYIISIFPLYQAFLLIFGALLGQFRFFWEKEKKMARWLGAKLCPGLSRP